MSSKSSHVLSQDEPNDVKPTETSPAVVEEREDIVDGDSGDDPALIADCRKKDRKKRWKDRKWKKKRKKQLRKRRMKGRKSGRKGPQRNSMMLYEQRTPQVAPEGRGPSVNRTRAQVKGSFTALVYGLVSLSLASQAVSWSAAVSLGRSPPTHNTHRLPLNPFW